MPHSGGGGSHGGGSHGGSHGSGSSHRVSHSYFPGARRYRRHYNDGREDEYFYSNTRPQKTGLSSIIFMLLFAGGFCGIFGYAGFSRIPKRLNEVYRAPSSYVWDGIDVIDEDSEEELEELLEDMNDTTGICPVVFTAYEDTIAPAYSDLEDFAHDMYVNEWDDEQHYLVVYTIPEDQAEGLRDGSIDVPDYAYEIMMGDETDRIISESIEDSFNQDLYHRFERGETPGEAFIHSFSTLSEKCERALDSKIPPLSAFLPIIICGLFFLIPIIGLIKNYIRDRRSECEEVPLTEQEDHSFTSAPMASGAASGYQNPAELLSSNKGIGMTIKIIYTVVLIPFVIIGISTITRGIVSLTGDGFNPASVFMLIFGLVWTGISLSFMIGVFKAFKKKKGSTPMTAEYPKAEMPHADYPSAQYPQQEYNSTTHNDCRSGHEEDEDSIRKGYE